jgi:hypothetical protein
MIVKASVRAFAAVVLLNALFLCVALYSASIPTTHVAFTARHAFETGALTDDNFLKADRERGYHQYNDCLIIQLIVNDVSLFDDALAPLARSNSDWTVMCAALRGIVAEGTTNFEVSFGYTRYWHGYVPIATFLLSVFDLDAARTVLKSLVYLSLLGLALSALRAPTEAKIFTASVAGASALFWAVPYFGQSLAHAPGDAFLMLGLAGFFFFSDRMCVRRALLPYSATFGAGVAYLEFWTGQLPTAAGFLFVAAYLAVVMHHAPGKRLIDAWIAAGVSVLAFLAGAAFSVVSKQALAIMLTDAPVLALFMEQLSYYSGVDSSTRWAGSWGRLSGFLLLLSESATLTHWSKRGALLLGIGAMGAWVGAGLLAWYRSSEGLRPVSDLLAFATGSAAAFVWPVIFSTHTAIHAEYMSRILILPVALGVAVLMIQSRKRRHQTLTGSNRILV